MDLSLQGEALTQAFAAAAGPGGYQVIVDYIWGPATEALLATLNNHDLSSYAGGRGIRLVNVGSMAAADIRLPAAVLRSNQLQILGSGTGNFPPIPEMQLRDRHSGAGGDGCAHYRDAGACVGGDSRSVGSEQEKRRAFGDTHRPLGPCL